MSLEPSIIGQDYSTSANHIWFELPATVHVTRHSKNRYSVTYKVVQNDGNLMEVRYLEEGAVLAFRASRQLPEPFSANLDGIPVRITDATALVVVELTIPWGMRITDKARGRVEIVENS